MTNSDEIFKVFKPTGDFEDKDLPLAERIDHAKNALAHAALCYCHERWFESKYGQLREGERYHTSMLLISGYLTALKDTQERELEAAEALGHA